MFGASYVTVVGFVFDFGILCRECAQKREDKGEVRLYTDDARPYYQYQADSLPEGEEDYCDHCTREIGGDE